MGLHIPFELERLADALHSLPQFCKSPGYPGLEAPPSWSSLAHSTTTFRLYKFSTGSSANEAFGLTIELNVQCRTRYG